MKIVLVHNCYQQQGGEDVVFTNEAALLRDHGHEVVEYTDHNDRIDDLGRLRLAAGTIWSRYSRKKISSLIKTHRPQVAHFQNTFPLISPSSYYSCQREGVAVIQTLQNYRLVCPSATLMRDGKVCESCLGKSFAWPGVRQRCYHASSIQTAVIATMLTTHRLLKSWNRQVDIYIALTKFARRKFIEGGLPAEKIVVKPNILSTDPGVGMENGNYTLFVGRLSPEKGIETMLVSWHHLKEISLKIVGDGPLMANVQEAAAQYKVPSIDILGACSRDEVLNLMRGCRFLVFPSVWYEGFPLTIAEAFACGVPVIASNLGAMAEIVKDGRTGLHFQSGDADDLAAKVEWAWSHSKDMYKMGREARREYELKYTAEKNYKMLMEIYQQAIERT